MSFNTASIYCKLLFVAERVQESAMMYPHKYPLKKTSIVKFCRSTTQGLIVLGLFALTGCQSGGDSNQSSGNDSGSGVSNNPQSPPVTQNPDNVPVIGGCQIFPADNFWNVSIRNEPVHPQSDEIINTIGGNTELHPDFGTEWQGAPNGIPYTIVTESQIAYPVSFLYDDESDPGPYPIPFDAPREGGVNAPESSDRHILAIQEGTCMLYEMYHAEPNEADQNWDAGSGAIWDLSSNQARPPTYTSADAAGLAILPGLVKYDEVIEHGAVHHALRFTLSRVARSYIPPASHSDGDASCTLCPAMGQKLRLKASINLEPFSDEMKVILRAMQEYGIVVADTGGNMFISGAPDPRWDNDMLHEIKGIKASDFEVIDMGTPIPY